MGSTRLVMENKSGPNDALNHVIEADHSVIKVFRSQVCGSVSLSLVPDRRPLNLLWNGCTVTII